MYFLSTSFQPAARVPCFKSKNRSLRYRSTPFGNGILVVQAEGKPPALFSAKVHGVVCLSVELRNRGQAGVCFGMVADGWLVVFAAWRVYVFVVWLTDAVAPRGTRTEGGFNAGAVGLI